MNAVSAETREKLELAAKLAAYKIPAIEIAKTVGLSEGRISQLMVTEEFQELVRSVGAAHFEDMQLLNEGWNEIEKLAVAQIIEHMQHGRDVEFAMKAAVVANRATRRGGFENPTIVGDTGSRAVISLNLKFVNHITTNDNRTLVIKRPEKDTAEKKRSDFLPPAAVDNILNVNTVRKNTDDALLPDFFNSAAE